MDVGSLGLRLGSRQRETLVQAAIRRLDRKARPRTDDELADVDHGYETGILLSYKSAALEDRFMRFIHSTPLFVTLLLVLTFGITYVIFFFVRRTLLSLAVAVIPMLFVVVLVSGHVYSRGQKDEKKLHFFLKIERLIITFALSVGCAGSVQINYSVLNDCTRTNFSPVGSQPKAYTEGYCQYWNGFSAIGFGLLAVLQVIRFKLMVGLTTVVALLSLTIWLAPNLTPHEDTAWVVVRLNLLTISSFVFVCFIRYVDEKQQRKYFEAQEALVRSAEELSAKRVATLDRFLAVLPQAVSKRLRGGHWDRSQVDMANDATVLVTRIHDFETWSTSMLPVEVAVAVAAMQTKVDNLLRRRQLERVGRLGDTTLTLGNLLEKADGNMAKVTIDVARQVVMLQAPAGPTLVAAVHAGEAEGVLQGAHYVRYEVRGPAVDATRTAVQLCSRRQRLVGSTAIASMATDDSSGWFEDDEELLVETGDEAVPFRHLIAERQSSVSEGSSTTQENLAVVAADVAGEGGTFVSAVSRLLDGHGSSTSELGLKSSSTTINANVTDGSGMPKPEPLAIVTDCLGFYHFADEQAEALFHEKRRQDLPQQSAKVWLGYACYVSMVLLTLLLELRGPFVVIGVVLLVLAILSSLCLAVVPQLLGSHRSDSANRTWTVVGLFVPLLTVFGCALSRPSMVGLDVRAFVAFGAFMRSYCMNNARLQAIGVPVFALISTLQYLIPGAHDNFEFLAVFLMFIVATVVAARNREADLRRNYRRSAEAEAVLQQVEEVSRVQRGLLQSSMPRCVFDAAVAADFKGSDSAFKAAAVVMVVRAASPSKGMRSGCVGRGLERVLDLVLPLKFVCTAGVLGDDAVLVGPVPTSMEEVMTAGVQEDAALQEALELGIAVTEAPPGGWDAAALSVLVDQDTVAHVVQLGSAPNYSLLGTSATRLICVGAQVSGMLRGLLVTDRVMAIVNTSRMLGDVVVEAQAPMTIRGQGVLRWNRIGKP